MIDTIFVPSGAEAGAVRRAVHHVRSSVRVVELGIGPLAARRSALEALQAGPCGTSLVTGLCGLLSPAFTVGDTLVYREIAGDGSATVALDRTLSDALANKLADVQTGVRAFASDRVVTTVRAKRELGLRTHAVAVDMESHAVARELQASGNAVAVVRVASDGANQSLPDLDRALDGSGGIDRLALALAMLREPRAGLRLARNGTRALASLRRALEMILR